MDERSHNDDLSVSEKILRLQDEWDEIVSLPDPVELTPEQLAELQRRLHDHRLHRRHYKTWEELRSELDELGDDHD